ncbi:MAG: hypothetical protein KH421_00005, partial [Akkermansia muciniphila]|nr:hypothetical protein [Akkermansia muciniphila]
AHDTIFSVSFVILFIHELFSQMKRKKILLRICNPPPEFPHGLPRAFFAHTIFSLPGVMDSCIMAFRSTPAYDTHDFKKENSLVSWSFELFCLSCRGFRCFLAEQE